MLGVQRLWTSTSSSSTRSMRAGCRLRQVPPDASRLSIAIPASTATSRYMPPCSACTGAHQIRIRTREMEATDRRAVQVQRRDWQRARASAMVKGVTAAARRGNSLFKFIENGRSTCSRTSSCSAQCIMNRFHPVTAHAVHNAGNVLYRSPHQPSPALVAGQTVESPALGRTRPG